MLSLSQIMLALIVLWQAGTAQRPAAEQLRQAQMLFDQRRFDEAAVAARKAVNSNRIAGGLEAERLIAATGRAACRGCAGVQRGSATILAGCRSLVFLARVQYLQSLLKPAEASARRA
jgi:hypothetical protein